MTLTELLIGQLEREAARTRRTLQEVPTGKDDWKPHDKSMPLGRLAGLVASMPSWVPLIVDQESLELNPQGGSQYRQPQTSELAHVHDDHVAKAIESLRRTKDDYLLTTTWRLTMNGKPVMEQLRHEVLADTFLHLAHHRGQLTVYLRMNEAKVPSVYGPSADDQRFL
ncbi:MAG: DinB family protein [Vicinamibacterales bacterium]